jgi:tRNA (mo5U34)-methyltransferase
MDLYDFITKDIEFNQAKLLDKKFDFKDILSHLKDRLHIITKPLNSELFSHFKTLPDIDNVTWTILNGIVAFKSGLTPVQEDALITVFNAFKPWRKGPFSFNSTVIDSEWQSQIKWDRMKPLLPNLEGKRLLDLGCGNGYYLFRMLEHSPDYVVGMDPTIPFYLQYKLFNKYMSETPLSFFPFGWEVLDVFDSQFDVVFCMGVLYHHKEPLQLLRQLKDTLRPGGQVVLETISYPSEEKMTFNPGRRYAGMRNIHKLPSPSQLEEWGLSVGFKHVEYSELNRTTSEEQRSTVWSSPISLKNQLNSKDISKTIEGYPSPHRIIVVFS